MNIYLLQLVGKLMSLLFMSVASMFGTYNFSQEVINVNNYDKDKGSKVVNTILEYDTVVKYNAKVPSNIVNVLVEGENGIVYQDSFGSTVKTLKDKIDRVIEIGTGKYGEYKGILTLYGPDCDTCDGLGMTYCPIAQGKYHNLLEEGAYFDDQQYGKIRILAAPLAEFPCGTIIEVTNSNMTKTIGIVLDTGGALVNAYNKGNILIDLAHESEEVLPHGTDSNTKFSVKRWGW